MQTGLAFAQGNPTRLAGLRFPGAKSAGFRLPCPFSERVPLSWSSTLRLESFPVILSLRN